jgi:hypothetical protein
MSFNDDFFEELLVLGATIKEIRYAMVENLPEPTLLALESANATLSTRALEILDDIVSGAVTARITGMDKDVPEREMATVTPISSPSTTVPENTSSQPSPSDLAKSDSDSKTGA